MASPMLIDYACTAWIPHVFQAVPLARSRRLIGAR